MELIKKITAYWNETCVLQPVVQYFWTSRGFYGRSSLGLEERRLGSRLTHEYAENARCMRVTSRPHLLVPQSRSQRPRSFWSATGIATSGLNLWPVPTPEVRDSRTPRRSAHAHSNIWQISLVLVSIYFVYKSIQDRNVDPGFSSAWQKGPLRRGCLLLCSLVCHSSRHQSPFYSRLNHYIAG